MGTRTLEAVALAVAIFRTVCSACVGSGYYPSGSLTPSIYTDYGAATRDWGYSDIDHRYYDPRYGTYQANADYGNTYQAYSDYYRTADPSYGYPDYSRRYPEYAYADIAYQKPDCAYENVAKECKCKNSGCECSSCRCSKDDGCGSYNCGCNNKDNGCSSTGCGCKNKDNGCSRADCGCGCNKCKSGCGNTGVDCGCRRRDSDGGDKIIYVIETSRDDCDCCNSRQRISELKDYIRLIKD